MTDQIDLSKYAAGKRLRRTVTGHSAVASVLEGVIYTSRGIVGGQRVELREVSGQWDACFFLPVEDAEPVKAEEEIQVGQIWRDNTGTKPEHYVTVTKVMAHGVEYDWPDTPGCFRCRGDFRDSFHRSAPAVEQPKPAFGDRNGWRHLPLPDQDPYQQHRKALSAKLDSAEPERDVGYETWCTPGQRAARDRMVAHLKAELDIPGSARRQALEKRFGGRDCDDWGTFSGPGSES